MCLITNYPIAICIPDKTAGTIVKAYLQGIDATFGGFLNLIIGNGKELSSELFQKVIFELGLKY